MEEDLHATRVRRSDYTPSDAERSQIVEKLQGEVEMLERCEEEIASLEEKLKAQKARKRGLKDNIRDYRSALSIHRRVPTEIWEMAFTHLCLSLHDYSFKVNYDAHHRNKKCPRVWETPTLVLSQVCRRWRQIVDGSPALWSSINVQLMNLPHGTDDTLSLHLAKAKNCPLSMRVGRHANILSPGSLRDRDIDFAVWLNLLSPRLSSCRELTLGLFWFDFDSLDRNLSFPHLEYFCEEIDHFSGPEDEQPTWFWEAIQQAPKLAGVTAWTLLPMLPFPQLISLNIRSIASNDVKTLLDTLPICERLEELSLCLEADWLQPPAETRERRVPSLKKLTLSRGEGSLLKNNSTLRALLTSLLMPSLVSFELKACEQGWPPELLTMAQRNPSLEKFEFSTHLVKGEDDVSTYPFTLLFQSLPELKHLELYVGTEDPTCDHVGSGDLFGSKVLSAVISNLRITPDSPVLLPKLEVLCLQLFPIALDSKVVDSVEDMLLSRHAASRAVRDFGLQRCLRKSAASKRKRVDKVVVDHDLVERIRGLGRKLGSNVIVKDAS